MSSVTCANANARSRVSHPRMNSRTTFSLRSTIGSIDVIGIFLGGAPARTLDMEPRTASFATELVVEVIAPTANFAIGVEIEHSDARQLETPSLAVEIPAVQALGTNRVAAPKHVEQFPFHLSGLVEDALNNLANVHPPDHGLG